MTDHLIALAEGPLESAVDFSENGLVAVLSNGIAVRSGQESGSVSVTLSVVEEPPALDPAVWDEIIDVSWRAPGGGAAFAGSGTTTQITPPWPGDYRVRVCARGRDEVREQFGFVVWRADAAADTDRLAAVPDGELRDLAWWIAAFAAAHSELAEHPAVTATLAARALTAEAEELARRSQLYEHRTHRWLWMTLHAATNPDPLGAAIWSLDAGRYAVAGHAADLLEQVRGRLGRTS